MKMVVQEYVLCLPTTFCVPGKQTSHVPYSPTLRENRWPNTATQQTDVIDFVLSS